MLGVLGNDDDHAWYFQWLPRLVSRCCHVRGSLTRSWCRHRCWQERQLGDGGLKRQRYRHGWL